MGSLGLGDGSLRMDDVYLEGATPEGPAMVGHLSVIVDTEGITFLGPEPGERRTVGWDRTSPLEFGPPAALPGGEAVTSSGVRRRRAPAAPAGPLQERPGGRRSRGRRGAGGREPPDRRRSQRAVVPVLAGAGGREPSSPVLAVADTDRVRARWRWAGTVGRGRLHRPRTTPTDEEETPGGAPRPVPALPRSVQASRRPALTPPQRMVRLVLVTVLLGLIPMAAGVWYFHLQPLPTQPVHALSDATIAARVGIQPGDLPGWSTAASRMGNPFAAGATTHGPAALRTAEQASTVLARCLHVPVSAVDGAFGMGSAVAQRTAQAVSPTYLDPSGNGGAVGSVVDVLRSSQAQQADASVFQDPALFATCYQPFVQAMLPWAPGGGSVGFATATVQPIVVPVPDGPATVTVAGFQIARIANGKGQTETVVTTATAVSDGRRADDLGDGERPRVQPRRAGPPGP